MIYRIFVLGSCLAFSGFDFVRAMEQREENTPYLPDDQTYYADNPLHRAAWLGDIDAVRKLVADGCDLNIRDAFGNAALHVACCRGQKEIADILLSGGARPNVVNNDLLTPLHYVAAAQNDQPVLAELLCSFHAKINMMTWRHVRPLHCAAVQGNVGVVDVLLDHLVVVDAADEKKNTALHYAVHRGFYTIVRLLLRAGANPNAFNDLRWTPLHCAVNTQEDRLLLLRLLLDEQAEHHVCDWHGNTPLHYALLNLNQGAAEILRGRGADDGALNFVGQTPERFAQAKVYARETLRARRVPISKFSEENRAYFS